MPQLIEGDRDSVGRHLDSEHVGAEARIDLHLRQRETQIEAIARTADEADDLR